MTTTSYTGRIIQTTYENVETLAGITLTVGNTYTIQIQNEGWLKVADAEFAINSDIPFIYTHGSDDLSLKTTSLGVVLTILENT